MKGCPAVRQYDLRHTSASLLLRAGVNLKVVSERLGHSTPTETLNTYQHVREGMQDRAAAAMQDLLSLPFTVP